MGEPYRTPEQPTQYPTLQEGAGINGSQAAHVIEVANIINDAQDSMPHLSGAEAADLQGDIDRAYEHLGMYIGDAAIRNLAQRPSNSGPDQPMQAVNHDGRIVSYGQMTRSVNGSRHPQTGRIVR